MAHETNNKRTTGKIAFIGGDMRMIYTALRFARNGYECALYATPDIPTDTPETLTRTADLATALTNVDFAVGPIPLSRDGMTVNAPCSADTVDLCDLIDAMPTNGRLYVGNANEQTKKRLTAKRISCIDYGEFEDFSILNARCSAEAALSIGISNHEKMLIDSSVAIFGYGRIGRQLTLLLNGMGIRPTVFARSELARAAAYSTGANSTDFDTITPRRYQFDILFNTVPSDLSEIAYTSLAQKGILIDLANVYKKSSNTIIASGLPGRYSPESAGEIVYRCIRDREKNAQNAQKG